MSDHTSKIFENFNNLAGACVKKSRLGRGLTQDQVAGICNIRFQQVQKYECGVNSMSFLRAAQVAFALEVSINNLLPSPLKEKLSPATYLPVELYKVVNNWELLSPQIQNAILGLTDKVADKASNSPGMALPETRIFKDFNDLAGKALHQARKLRSLTQGQLGDMVGIRFQQIQKYECGANGMSFFRSVQLVSALEIPITDLLPPHLREQFSPQSYIPAKLQPMVNNWHSLNPQTRKSILELADEPLDKGPNLHSNSQYALLPNQ